jgi:hypothetical protein
MGQQLFVLIRKAGVIRMCPRGMGVGGLAVQNQEREQAVGASNLDTISDKFSFFPGIK